ncbi:MAG: helix-turn-helix transcriptional regulator [Clostridia bacterium]|nr:helix-turn-helix transcriptional regulator [Clostridia bacterium]
MDKKWSKKIFARNLRRYMELSGKNQKELADVAGVSPPTFNEWINEKKFPRIDKIQRLADYFGILKSDLIEDKMTDEKEADNEALAGIIVRLRLNEDFLLLVKELNNLDDDQIIAVRNMLKTFTK